MRLIASDIDGTILGPDGRISARTVAAFHEAAAAGVEIVFVTGRPMRWLDPLRSQIGHTGTVICSNGAVTYDLAADAVVESHLLEWETISEVRDIIRRLTPAAHFALESLSAFHLEPGFADPDQARKVLGAVPPGPLEPAMAEGGIVKFLAVTRSGTADDFLELVRPRIEGLISVTHSAPSAALLEMGPLGIDKAVTLAAYAAARGIDAADVVAFGDMPNDIEMLRWAGTGYAMASGHPLAIAAAARTAPAFADDGVAQVIEAGLPALR